MYCYNVNHHVVRVPTEVKLPMFFFYFLSLVVQDPFCSYYSLPIVVTCNFNLLTFITKLNSGKFLVLGHDFCIIQAVSPFRRSPSRDLKKKNSKKSSRTEAPLSQNSLRRASINFFFFFLTSRGL